MGTLSSFISTFTIPKSTNLKNHLHHPSLKPKTTKLLSNKTTTTTTSFNAQNNLVPLPPHINSLKHSSKAHQRPSTGYAVALLDAARRHNVVDAVHRDAKRLSKLMADPCMDMDKAEIVKEVVKKGRFEKHLVKLVKLLSEKGKVDLVRQVLSEFGRIYDQLCVIDGQLLLGLPRGRTQDQEPHRHRPPVLIQ